MPVESRASHAPLLCVDIGGSFMDFGLVDAANAVRRTGKVPTPIASWPDFVAALALQIEGSGIDDGAPIALSVAGPVDPDTGVLISANIPCANGRSLGPDLSAALGRPVAVANDADCFALAEANAGAGMGHRVVFGVILGTGVGGGLIVDGRLVPGAGGVSGEWGHGPITGGGVPESFPPVPRFACGCGQSGCVDTVGGARGLERLHRHLHAETIDSRTILTRWHHGDRQAARTLELWLSLVADPLALVVNVTGASSLPAGGGLASDAELVAVLDTEVRRRIMRPSSEPLLVQARHPDQAALIGAAVLARQTL
ncbi:N-acetylglucosamine kinase [Faunimonas pinastri]|uniref:N-acetylglucosamine kinase n=1 Tax=Faunimonas pinastri TaxID=1855383 RepID=A0A1H9PAT7_9HYPH|nr:ROK family protein [Faunimonas pinastri]SER45374.1 N-acetylglucosamine kinase [Faunimonas pinastri]